MNLNFIQLIATTSDLLVAQASARSEIYGNRTSEVIQNQLPGLSLISPTS